MSNYEIDFRWWIYILHFKYVWNLPKLSLACFFFFHFEFRTMWHKSILEKTNTVASSTAMAPPSPTYYQPQSNVFDLDFSLLRRRHHKWCRHHVCNSISQTSIVLVLLICSNLYTIPSTIKTQMNIVLFCFSAN